MWDTHEGKVLELVTTETFVLSMNSIGEYQMHTGSPPELYRTQTVSHDKWVLVTTVGPQVLYGGMASNMDSSCEYTE
jgi:hypothetical protein